MGEKHEGGGIIRTLRVAGIQFAAFEEKERNVNKARELATLAVEKGAAIVSFAELCTTPWFPSREASGSDEHTKLAETIPGPATEEFSSIAKASGAVFVLPIYEVSGDSYFNSAAVIDADGSLLGAYRKIHLPRLPLWYEKDYFTPGNTGFPVFKTKHGVIGVQICWDNFFPEGPRALGLAGAEILITPTASAMKTFDRWEKVISSHAITNLFFALRVNRAGSEPFQDFYGESFCVTPEGEMVGTPAGMDDSVSLFDIDLEEVARSRKLWPYYEDRRPETYGILAKK